MVLEAYGADRLSIAKVLVKVADISTLPNLTLAMAKNDSSLFILRIKRIIGMEKMRIVNFSQIMILAAFLSVSIVGMLSVSDASASSRAVEIFHESDSTILMQKERELLLQELRVLYSELEGNSVNLPGIEIKGNGSNQSVLSDLESQVSSHLAVNTSDEHTQIDRALRVDSLWKLIEKKNARVGEIGSLEMASFKAHFERFWSELNNHVALEEVKEISLKNRGLYIDSIAQTEEKYKTVLGVFEKHLGNESFLDLNLHVKRK